MRNKTTSPIHSSSTLEPSPVNVRIKLSALWAAMLFVFAYVDIFSGFRADIRADIEAGELAGFTINDAFLTGTTVYVLIPILMIFGVMVMRPRLNRIANIGVGGVYAVSIIAGAIGEWNYYILGSAVEVALLALIVYYAWTWPHRIDMSVNSGKLDERDPRSVPAGI